MFVDQEALWLSCITFKELRVVRVPPIYIVKTQLLT